jgi:glycosyltransferase involved in cell wall biosynthesis
VVAISEHVRQSFVELGLPPERLETIHYGLAPAAAAPGLGGRLREEWGLPAEALVVGAVGRLVEQKGHATLLEAAARLRDCFPSLHLVLVGEGELAAALRARADALGLGDRLHLLGWRPDADACMAAFDVLAHPSRWEGLGLVLLEAMARARPIVASRVSAIPEIVADGQTGRLVEPDDPDALARALADLLADPVRRQALGAAGRRRLEERFTVERMTAATVGVYDRANVRD